MSKPKTPKNGKASEPKIPRSEKVSEGQKEFCLHYVQLKIEHGGNTHGIAIEAYRRSGYKGNYGTMGKQAHLLLKMPKIQTQIRQIEESVNYTSHGTRFGRILDAAETLARISRLATASPIDLLDEKGEYDVNYIREHGLEYLCSAVEITTTRYPNGTEKTTRRIKVEPRKGFLELLGNHHGLIKGDDEERAKALARALTGKDNPDHDDVLSKITGIPKALLQSAPLDGPVPMELRETSPGMFEVEKPKVNG